MVFIYCGLLAGHRGWVTSMVTPPTITTAIGINSSGSSSGCGNVQLISASRDRSVVMWSPVGRTQHQYSNKKSNKKNGDVRQQLSKCSSSSSLLSTPSTSLQSTACRAEKKLEGHAHFIVDVAISEDGTRIATASWDTVVRVWRADDGICARRFSGHSKDVNAVTFIPGTASIVASAGKDKSIRVWAEDGGVLAHVEDAHEDWVSCIRPAGSQNGCPTLVSTGWDGKVRLWSLTDKSLVCIGIISHRSSSPSPGPTAIPNPLAAQDARGDPLLHCAISPDCSLVGTVSKGGTTRLWDISALIAAKPPTKSTTIETDDASLLLLNLEAVKNSEGTKDFTHQICFAPHQFYVCIAADSCVRVYDIPSRQVIAELVPEVQDRSKRPQCTSLAWAPDGSVLYTGYTDNTIRMWGLPSDV